MRAPRFALIHCIPCALLLIGAPATGPAAGAPKREITPVQRVEVLRLRAEGVDADALRDELQLRLPEVQIVKAGAGVPEDALLVYADVAARDSGGFTLTLIVSDGRAYDRVVEPDDAPPQRAPRLLGTVVANLVLGIQEHSIEPDRDEVPIPEEPKVEVPKPEKVCPKCPEPEPVERPLPQPQRPLPPRAEFGPRVELGAAIGLGDPNDVDRFVGWGGTLGLDVRLRSGALLVVEARALGRRSELGSGLLRIRFAAGAGYVWRPDLFGAFELAAAGLFTVEPWYVFRGSSRVVFDGATPAIGFAGRLAPGYAYRTPTGRLALRVGGVLELAGSSAPGAGVVKISDREGDELKPAFRLGGPEIYGGAQFTLWFGI